MKIKDYFRLSRISLKSRKKSTRSTVRGISFGLILLMPLIFLVIAFYIDLDQRVNADVAVRVFNVSYTQDRTDSKYIESVYDEYREDIVSIEGVVSTFRYNYFTLLNTDTIVSDDGSHYTDFFTSVKIGNNSFELNYQDHNSNFNRNSEEKIGFTVIYQDNETIFNNYDYEVLNGENPVLYGTVFTENSSKEIMLSSEFLEQYNLNGEDIIGKEISIFYELIRTSNISSSLSSIETESLNIYEEMPVNILSNFKVVGIFNSKIYNSPARMESCGLTDGYNNLFNEPYFWITSKSVFNSNNEDHFPNLKTLNDEYNTKFYYYDKTPITMANEAKLNGCIFLPFGFGASQDINANSTISYYELIEFNTFSNANKAINIIDGLYKKSTSAVEDVYVNSNYQNETFINYNIFYEIFTYICIVLAMFGGIIFFATLLNLYNTIHYSVQSRRNYIGMMRAIGMKSRNVISLFFTEVLQIFLKSYFWTAIFGGLICCGLSYLFAEMMNSSYTEIISIKLTLNYNYILVSFGLLVVLNMIISVLFALVASFGVSKKPILDVLNEDR